MPDPTEALIACSFSAALCNFVGFAAWRMVVAGKRPPLLAAVPVPLDPENTDLTAMPTPEPPDLPVGKVPVWFYLPMDLLGAACVFLVFAALALITASASEDAVPTFEPSTLLLNMGFQVVLVGAVAWWVVRRVGCVTWLGLRWPSWPWVFLLAPGAVVFMWTIFACLKEIGYMEWMESLGVETVQETVKVLQKSEDPVVLVLMAVAAMVVAPLCEEIVFRGYFYPVLKRFAGMWPAAASASLVFASAHGNLTALLPLFIFGGLLVFVYEKTGSLWAPIAVHCCFNSATVLAQFVVRYYHLPLEGMP